jgi:hypothetical protein
MVRKVDLSSPAWMPGFDGRLVNGTGLVMGEEVEVESVGVTGGAEQSNRRGSCLGGDSSRAQAASRDSLSPAAAAAAED